MPERESSACDGARDLIEPYLDGELAPAEAARLRRHLGVCPGCTAELGWAAEVRAELRALPLEACPEPVVRRVLAVARAAGARTTDTRTADTRTADTRIDDTRTADTRTEPEKDTPIVIRHRLSWLRRPRVVWPAFAAAALAAAVLGGRLLAPRPAAPPPVAVAAADLERAEHEARWALALVGELSRRAGTTLRDDVLRERVGDAPRRALVRIVESGG